MVFHAQGAFKKESTRPYPNKFNLKHTIMKHLLFFCSVLFLRGNAVGQTANQVVAGEKHSLYSKIMDDEKEYWVHLPATYASGESRYPVLYITDGGEHFYLATGVTEFMSSQYLIPEMIVVAIFHKDRNHDLTPTHNLKNIDGFESDAAKVSGGGKNFLQFIEKELVPEVERTYRTGPFRVLAGHSLGGLFVAYAYLNDHELFDAFISMDPALQWDNSYCERTLNQMPGSSSNLKSKFYMSSAHNAAYDQEDKSKFRLSQNSFSKLLLAKQIENTKHEYFETQSHLKVPYHSLYAGLDFTFSDYYILDDPDFELEIPFIQAFYERQSDRFGMTIKPSERLVEMFGRFFLYDLNEYSQSVQFFELNAMNYPNSARAFAYLAKAYKATGAHSDALLNFKTALKLNPGDTEIMKELAELERIE